MTAINTLNSGTSASDLFFKIMNLNGFRGFFINFLLGSLAVLGHAPFYLWPITILCLALFLLRLDCASAMVRAKRAGFWSGFAFGLGYFLFGMYWIGSAFIARGPEFVPFMPFAVLALCAGLAVFWGVGGLSYTWLVRKNQTSPWRAGIFASVFFSIEFARGHFFGGFPWNLPGYIFPAGQSISQIASIFGIYGVTALVFLLAASLALILPAQKKTWIPFVVMAGVLAFSFIYGTVRLKNAQLHYVPDVKLRIVHAHIPQRDKFDGSKYVQNANTYLRLTRGPGFENVTHIIWPEGAVPGLMLRDQALMQAIEDTIRSGTGDAPVFITQTLRAEPRLGKATPAYLNSATAMSFPPNQARQLTSFYDKQRLVPFGEFIPGGKVLGKIGLKSLSSALESMTPGQGGATPNIPGLPPVSIQICYEIIFPGFTSQTHPPQGARPQWILNLSNDAWYGNSTGPRQHINQARYRAIEQGLPVVRATSGGVSGVIDPYGRQIVHLGLNDEGALDVDLPTAITPQLYNKCINFIILLIIVILLIGCILGMRKR